MATRNKFEENHQHLGEDLVVNRLPKLGFYRVNDILEIIPIGRSTWWQWVASGKAPEPVRLGPRTTAWRMEDIDLFIDFLGKQNGESK